jgi:3',5'-cyclic AMP phosphodiesterase CpdA
VDGVRVIGFDVTVAGKPYGQAGPERLKWLSSQLSLARKKKLVIIATHQLLLPTTPKDIMPEWSLWMVRNHQAVRELLEQFPNVRLVLSGHHHATRVETVNGITYAADPATVTYPCAFRIISVDPRGISIRSVGLNEGAAVSKAKELLIADPYARLYDPERPENVLSYSIGATEQDREADIPL